MRVRATFTTIYFFYFFLPSLFFLSQYIMAKDESLFVSFPHWPVNWMPRQKCHRFMSCFGNRQTEPNGRLNKVRALGRKHSQTCFGCIFGSLHLLNAWYVKWMWVGDWCCVSESVNRPGSLSLLVSAKSCSVFLVCQAGHRGESPYWVPWYDCLLLLTMLGYHLGRVPICIQDFKVCSPNVT